MYLFSSRLVNHLFCVLASDGQCNSSLMSVHLESVDEEMMWPVGGFPWMGQHFKFFRALMLSLRRQDGNPAF